MLASDCSTFRASSGRRAKFRFEEDLVILLEAFAGKAHVDPLAELRAKFELLARKEKKKKIRTILLLRSRGRSRNTDIKS